MTVWRSHGIIPAFDGPDLVSAAELKSINSSFGNNANTAPADKDAGLPYVIFHDGSHIKVFLVYVQSLPIRVSFCERGQEGFIGNIMHIMSESFRRDDKR